MKLRMESRVPKGVQLNESRIWKLKCSLFVIILVSNFVNCSLLHLLSLRVSWLLWTVLYRLMRTFNSWTNILSNLKRRFVAVVLIFSISSATLAFSEPIHSLKYTNLLFTEKELASAPASSDATAEGSSKSGRGIEGGRGGRKKYTSNTYY